MKKSRFPLVGIVLVGVVLCSALLGVVIPTAPVSPDSPTILAQATYYHEDALTGRRTSEIKLTLAEAGGSYQLSGTAAAVGPWIDAAPGYEGRRGANVITAQKLEEILDLPHEFLACEASSGAVVVGLTVAGRRGRLPIRAIAPDGTLDLEAWTAREFCLELHLDGGGLVPGRYVSEFQIFGVPRMRVVYEVGSVTRFVSFESLHAPQPGIVSPSAGSTHPSPRLNVQGSEAKPDPLPKNWKNLDVEARWVVYLRKTRSDPDARFAWTTALGVRGEFEFLEWVAIYDPAGLGSAGHQLLDRSAPQFPRASAWSLPAGEGLGPSKDAGTQLKSQAGLVLDWLDRNPSFRDGRGKALHQEVLKDPEGKATVRVDARKRLSPLDAKKVLVHLDAPSVIQEFGDRARAEKGVVYLHQVERAIEGLIIGCRVEEPWIGKLRALTKHADWRIRRAALLGFSRLPESMPRAALLAQSADAKEHLEVRKAALLAYSYVWHPEVMFPLYRIASDPKGPLWAVAVSRLADMGGEFALTVFDALKFEDTKRESFLVRERARLQARLNRTDGPEREYSHLIMLEPGGVGRGDEEVTPR